MILKTLVLPNNLQNFQKKMNEPYSSRKTYSIYLTDQFPFNVV